MKKQWIVMVFAALCSITAVNAQSPGQQRMTTEERMKIAMEKMEPLKMDAETKSKVELIVADFYAAQQKGMEEMRESGSFDRDAMMAMRKELSEARDAKLKKVLTPAQMKQWIDEIEPSLRPQRKG